MFLDKKLKCTAITHADKSAIMSNNQSAAHLADELYKLIIKKLEKRNKEY